VLWPKNLPNKAMAMAVKNNAFGKKKKNIGEKKNKREKINGKRIQNKRKKERKDSDAHCTLTVYFFFPR